ncbi:MAG: hypothetical protein V7676_12445 [Parasphingorhabdus sp.]|uniref:hypothetical protein n=1 Tax=Parasphingorhabdus sp. TaxID=2709688 RepID=UPI00300190DD
MTLLQHFKAAILGAAVLLLSSCGDDAFPDYHYKMTVHIGDAQFSSVRALKQEQVSSIADSSGQTVKRLLEGQAVIIEFEDGETVYALLGKPDEPEYAQKVAGYALLPLVPQFKRDPKTDDLAVERGTESLDRMADAQQAMVKIEGPQDLPRTRPNPFGFRDDQPTTLNSWPMFVTFRDPDDPKTVREVSPGSIGVDRITIEITDEDVTEGIKEKLTWITRMRGDLLNSASVTRPNAALAGQIGTGDFFIGNSE